MSKPLFESCAVPIWHESQVTKSVTANVDFLNIDLRVNGKGSEYYDYDIKFILHSSGGTIYQKLNNLLSYSRSIMRGYSSTSDAKNDLQSVISLTKSSSASYPALVDNQITGLIGHSSHNNILSSAHDLAGTSTQVEKGSWFTTDTTSEKTSIQFFSIATETITYTLIITAIPKLAHNPNARLLKYYDLSAQTADFALSGLNGELYNYLVTSSGLTSGTYFTVHINGSVSADKISQRLRNQNGTIVSSNLTSNTFDSFLTEDATLLIQPDVGRKKLSNTSFNRPVSAQQSEDAFWNTDTTTPLTSIMFAPISSLSGQVRVYEVDKNYSADMAPFRDFGYVDISGDFSAGHSIDIPEWADFMGVWFDGEASATVNLNLLPNDSTATINRQYLRSATSSTTANFASDTAISTINLRSNSNTLIALKEGYNRPILSKFSNSENTIQLNGQTIADSTTVYTTMTIKASNTNTITGKLIWGFL